MCELFGLSAGRPVPLRNTPLIQFPRRGGQTADNPDGWGLVWREPSQLPPLAFQAAKEPTPGCDSALFAELAETRVSDLAIGHVRKARFPPVNTVNNTHPFIRECCGHVWAFAHNGLVPDLVAVERTMPKPFCSPVGETDSEFAFCHLLGHLNDHYTGDWLDQIGRVSESIARNGKFNFLLSEGSHLIAYGHDRLHYLETSEEGEPVVVVATEPLSDHPGWTPFGLGELRIYLKGLLVAGMQTHPPVPGIESNLA